MKKTSIVNCDETWCRVKIQDIYRKKYIWCLVNKDQKIVIYYLKYFRKQFFAYLEDGRYSIDNSIAERFIRSLTGERKNSLFFGSNRMNVSAAYHTLISMCRMNGIPALEYLQVFFREIV